MVLISAGISVLMNLKLTHVCITHLKCPYDECITLYPYMRIVVYRKVIAFMVLITFGIGVFMNLKLPYHDVCITYLKRPYYDDCITYHVL